VSLPPVIISYLHVDGRTLTKRTVRYPTTVFQAPGSLGLQTASCQPRVGPETWYRENKHMEPEKAYVLAPIDDAERIAKIARKPRPSNNTAKA
jgi:hypothetical protein